MNILTIATPERTFSSQMFAGIKRFQSTHPQTRFNLFRRGDGASLESVVAGYRGPAMILDFAYADLKHFKDPKVPAVIMDFGCGALGVPNSYRVGFRNDGIGALAADHLADEGVRGALVVCSAGSTSASPRWEGFRERAEQRGLRASYCVIDKGEHPDPARALALDNQKVRNEIRGLGDNPGVFGVDFRCTERALEIIQDAGWQLPRDVALVGVTSIPFLCENSLPPLTAIHLDHEAQGAIAAELAVALAQGTQIEQLVHYAPLSLEVRQSSSRRAHQDPAVAEALEFIAEHLDDPITSQSVARHLNLSRRTLERRFQRSYGCSPAHVIRQERMKATLRMLAETALPLKVVSERNGWSEPGHMGRYVKQATGLTPARYRQRVSPRSSWAMTS